MKKRIIRITLITIVVIANNIYGQNFDPGLPANNSMQLDGDTYKSLQNSVNKVDGSVNFALPLASIAVSSINFPINLSYNSKSAMKIAKQTNKYSPTSITGAGWIFNIPKIVVDDKNTATRDDDEFYFVDGGTNSKLICTERGDDVWEFKLENFLPWVIKYHKGFSEFTIDPITGNHIIVYREADYWSVIDENGIKHFFGYPKHQQSGLTGIPAPSSSSKSKEFISRWGNWIGDSNKSPNGNQAVIWNLSKIEDQWGNYLEFIYELVEGKQNNTQNSYMHTEASYLKEIVSSKGSKVVLNYNSKSLDEFIEPHAETAEPDAYQERYEKKFLESVLCYNNENEQISSLTLNYDLNGIGVNKKRYLTSLTKTVFNHGSSYVMPPEVFEYNFTGDFKGALSKRVYSNGGEVSYSYQSKTLFTNDSNNFENSFTLPSGFETHSIITKDNYVLYFANSSEPVTGGKYEMKIFRFTWNGKEWEKNEFTFPHLVTHGNFSFEILQNFYVVLEEDFYAFAYDKGSSADIYMFHLEKDKSTWNYFTHSSLDIANEDPKLMSGNGFVALGSHRGGKLFTYVWNGYSWNYKQISQGAGQYYYGATNNFIIALDEDGGNDMVTGQNHSDNYYFHYLDIEKKWNTKSWSAAADPYINSIEESSSFYPNNSIIAFVAHDNPELFLRWNSNYELTDVDTNVLGSYDDRNPIQGVSSSLFTIYDYLNYRPYKSARFNGVSWSEQSYPSQQAYAYIQFGKDIVVYQDGEDIRYQVYDPNTELWYNNILNTKSPLYTSDTYPSIGDKFVGINYDFIVAGENFYKRSTQSSTPSFSQIGTLQNGNSFTFSDGLGHALIEQPETISNANDEFTTLNFIDKESGLIEGIDLGNNRHHIRNIGANKFGRTTRNSPKSMYLRAGNGYYPVCSCYLYRIIDDKVNQVVSDIVVDYIEMNDDNGNLRIIDFTYNNPDPDSNNGNVYYGEVIVKHMGFGGSSLGAIKTFFNTGSEDFRMTGLITGEQVIDDNNNVVKDVVKNWSVYEKYYSNGSNIVETGFYTRLTSQNETLYFGNDVVSSTMTSYYNSNGQLWKKTNFNSKGKSETKEIRYAYQDYSFLISKNILSPTSEITTSLDNIVVSKSKDVWENNSAGKSYLKENWSGPNTSDLRLNSQISYVDNNGNALEINNGKGIFTTSLNGYNDNYKVASISNSSYQDVINELDVTYTVLQTLTTESLKVELMKLYDRLPEAMISLSFYDENGRLINSVNERKEESYVYYDVFGNLEYITDGYGNILEKSEQNFGN